VDLSGGSEARRTVLLNDVLSPNATFLADGRVVASSGGSVGAWDKRELKVFSSTGELIRDIPIGDGSAPRMGIEMFPGILAVRAGKFMDELSLVDVEKGVVVRRIPNVSTPSWFFRSTTPPGTPAARLLQSNDGRLYELPSLTAEPRLLLPVPR
jgi:hypothetical protein